MSSEASSLPFRTVLRGYEPAQVDQHIRELTTSLTALQEQSEQLQRHTQDLQSRLDNAEAAVVAAQDVEPKTPTFTDFGERVAKILSLADEEARDLVLRAQTDAQAHLTEAEQHAKKVREEAEQYSVDWKSEVDAEAARILEEARSQADDMRDEAERVRAESERELAAATQRRDSINAQLTNVRQMLATLSGSPAMPLDLLDDQPADAKKK